MNFQFGWAFLGGISLPLLVGVYLLRSQFRRQKVSALFLWKEHVDAFEGGLRYEPFRASLLFFLEFIALVLLTLAASGPEIPLSRMGRELVVVLDDSFSMSAGGNDSPRKKALEAFHHEMAARQGAPLTLIKAGVTPEILGRSLKSDDEIQRALGRWGASAGSASLEEAVVLARDMGRSRADIIVLTDHACPDGFPPGEVQWWAFGESRSNTAFITALWTKRDGGDRLFFEIANFSAKSKSTVLTVKSKAQGQTIKRLPLDLLALEVRRVVCNVDSALSPVVAELESDDLAIDNRVILFGDHAPPIRISVDIQRPDLRQDLEKALMATEKVLIGSTPAQLVFSETGGDSAREKEQFRVEFHRSNDVQTFIGPFILDRLHPLTDGLTLAGVAWGANSKEPMKGKPVITAGNVPLVTQIDYQDGKTLMVNMNPEWSTFAMSPDWPIFVWNILHWRQSLLPGPVQPNVKLGAQLLFRVPPEAFSAVIEDEKGKEIRLNAADGVAVFLPAQAGMMTLRVENQAFPFAVNALSREESNVTRQVSGRWGNESVTVDRVSFTQKVAWIFLLFSVIVLMIHQFVLNSFAVKRA